MTWSAWTLMTSELSRGRWARKSMWLRRRASPARPRPPSQRSLRRFLWMRPTRWKRTSPPSTLTVSMWTSTRRCLATQWTFSRACGEARARVAVAKPRRQLPRRHRRRPPGQQSALPPLHRMSNLSRRPVRLCCCRYCCRHDHACRVMSSKPRCLLMFAGRQAKRKLESQARPCLLEPDVGGLPWEADEAPPAPSPAQRWRVRRPARSPKRGRRRESPRHAAAQQPAPAQPAAGPAETPARAGGAQPHTGASLPASRCGATRCV